MAYVAAGRYEGYWEDPINAWDIAAGMLLVQEAGGRVSNFANRLVQLGAGELAASNGHIHAQMLRVLTQRARARAR